jgi:preprotein translocase subunit SecA
MSKKITLKKLNKILKSVRKCQDEIRMFPDGAIAAKTDEFRARLSQGETLDDLLPEAFAVACEADRRILGKDPYDVQILGGIAMHFGCLTEMNTGEGKTLVATLPLYLNALDGKGAILLTTNEYLAIRDAEEMGQVYKFLGLTIGVGVRARADEKISNKEKKEIYACDIVYTIHSVLGFDYLFNNLVSSAKERFMRELNFVIIDEADSVLLDSAQMPLVISGAPRVQSNLYATADFFVSTLEEGRDYETEEKKVWLTERGIKYAERFFEIDNLYGKEYFEINRHVVLALRAHVLYEQEKEYMVSNKGEIVLLDNGSGRMMPGVKLRGGQHQALEQKEKIKVSQENRSVASITYQNLFLLFNKMAGMSGTISDAAEELEQVYGTQVIVIPPRCPLKRRDKKDVFFSNKTEQFEEAISESLRIHKTGQPVLIVTSTIGETEYVSGMLIDARIPHNVLNANNAFWEADMIKEAGQMGAVTVATSMAGRGTDIKLGPGVKEIGGLAVIGIGRMINVRQERQARGRAGRQGDPGLSHFYVCLEDDVVVQNGPTNLEKYIDGDRHISKGRLKKIINSAQKVGEELAVSGRKQAMDYDYVLQLQRNLMYDTRNKLLDGENISEEWVMELVKRNVHSFLLSESEMEYSQLTRYILNNISYRLDNRLYRTTYSSPEQKKELEEYLLIRAGESLREQKQRTGSRKSFENFMRVAALKAIDEAWVEQVDYLQQLQTAVTGRSSAQRNPVYEYQKEALYSFGEMKETILKNITRNILLSNVYLDEDKKIHIVLP